MLDIDTAIKHCLDVAEQNETQAEKWHKEGGAVKLSNMKEALELIREYKSENIAQKKMIAEYKRLLKAAVEDFELIAEVKDCSVIDISKYKWRYADEALKLIGEDEDVNT